MCCHFRLGTVFHPRNHVASQQTRLANRCLRFHVMTFVGLCTCLIIGTAGHRLLAASNSNSDPALNQAFQALVKLELGQDLGVFHPIELAVSRSHTDEKVRTDLERRLISVIQSDATDLAKEYACRQLTLIGSDGSIPALATLLSSPRLSHMARYAMEGIGSKTVATTLRAALKTTDSRQRTGIVISLGRMADPNAVAAISALLDEESPELQTAVVIALGRIGTVRASEALTAFAAKAPKTLKSTVVNARLQAAEALCRQRKYQAARAVYKSLQSADSTHVQAAAFRGLILANPAESLAMIVSGLAAKENWKRAVAADCTVALKTPKEIGAIASAVPTLPVSGQLAALASLRNHCHPAIRDASLKLLAQSADVQVRTAALETMIVSGTARDVARLAELASTSEDSQVRQAAFQTLCLMPAPGTDHAILALMNQDKTLNPVVVQCALARRQPDFVPGFLQAARSSDKAIQLEAFKALEIMATAKDAEALAEILAKTVPGPQREAAGRAVWMACQKITDSTKRAAPLAAAMKRADATGQCAILPSLARLGGTESLAAVHSAMQNPDSTVRDAGYRALANWPDATVAGELLSIAKSSKVDTYCVWSLRAFVRVVSVPGAFPPQEAFKKLNSVMQLAKRPEDRQLIVTRLGSVRVPDALTRLLSFVDDPELKDAAVPAIFTLAKGLSQSHPDLAANAMRKIRPLTQDPAILQQMSKVLRDMEARKQKQKKN